jgi:hypothetical protein
MDCSTAGNSTLVGFQSLTTQSGSQFQIAASGPPFARPRWYSVLGDSREARPKSRYRSAVVDLTVPE